MGSANKHGGVPGRSRPCLDHRDRPLALVQPGIHAASSEAGARRHRRYSHASTNSFSAVKGPTFLQNLQLRGASIFRYPLVPLISRTSISLQVPFMSHHCGQPGKTKDLQHPPHAALEPRTFIMSRAGARRIVRPPPVLRPDLYLRALALVVLLLWSIPASFRLGVPVVMCVGGWCSRPRIGLWRTAVKYKPPPYLIGEIIQTPPLGSLKYTNATTTTKIQTPLI